ncbi:hypothetical protein D9M72_349610 [compost metagenome]
MARTSVITQCSTADWWPSRPISTQASRTMAGSTVARLAARPLKKAATLLSSGASDSQATSKSSVSRAWRHAASVLVLAQPAGPWITTQRWRRASARRASRVSRGISGRAPRGGTSLVGVTAKAGVADWRADSAGAAPAGDMLGSSYPRGAGRRTNAMTAL